MINSHKVSNDAVQTHNASNKRFRCMYCLLEYLREKIPIENQLIIEQLWDSMTIKYSSRYIRYLLSKNPTENNFIDLWCDIECQRCHLVKLIFTLECTPDGHKHIMA